jgi:hypothetical protein
MPVPPGVPSVSPLRTVVSLVMVFVLGLALVAVPAEVSAETITFEDMPDNFSPTWFPTLYHGVTWTSGQWLHYAPYEPNGYDPDGVNAIYAANLTGIASADQYNSFTFPDQVFVGASFSAPLLLTPEFSTRMFFELYHAGTLVHTSGDLASGSLTFLPSGYAGAVDEVRVWTVGNGGTVGSLMTAGGSAWIMDNVTLESVKTVPETGGTLQLLGAALVAIGLRRHRRRR